jgi:DNA polymerase I-like protein with 3'-5' exonuclease and polymerase domains
MTNVVDMRPKLLERSGVAKHTLLTPEQVLPDPSRLFEPISVDTETSGLYVDEGHRVCAVSTSFRTKDAPHVRTDLAFPFDQGRHEEKGFEIQRYKAGHPKGVASEAELEDWLADYNLGDDQWRWLCDWLKASGHEVGHVYQNAQFDLLMMDAGLRTGAPGVWLEPYVVWDTMLASKNLWPTELTGLKPTGARLFGEERVADAAELKDALLIGKKLFGLRAEHGPRYDLVPWSINGKYAASDTSLTLDIKELQHKMLEDGMGQGWADFNREMNLMRVLTRMSHRGFGPYSVQESHEWANVIAGRLQEIEPTLPFVRLGSIASDKVPAVDIASSEPEDYPIVGASAVRASEYYFEQLGLKPWKVGETRRGYEIGKGIHKKFVPGNKADRREIERRFPTEAAAKLVTFKQGELTADIAKRLGEEGAPGATDYAEYLRLKIANQMFYRNYAELAGPDNKLRTTYRQAHVKSGRMSVEHFQAQALPKKLDLVCHDVPVPEPRAFFGVPEGYERWNLDLSQAELRIAANLAHCKGLMQELNEDGRDVHGATTERTFGITPDHPEWKGKRDVAKRLNFGGIFMIGPKTFQTNLWTQGGIEWSLAQCKEAVYAFRAAYPEIEDAYQFWLNYAAQYGSVKLYNGQRSWFGKLDYPNTGWNRRVQGSLAVWVAEWLTLVEQITEKHEALVLSVHDSAVLDLPKDKAPDIVARVLELSTELWEDRFGFPGKVDADTWDYHKDVDLLVPAHLARQFEGCAS